MSSYNKNVLPSLPLLMTVQETALLLRIQRAKVYDLLEIGSLEGSKVGNTWRIRLDSIEKMVGPIDELYASVVTRKKQKK